MLCGCPSTVSERECWLRFRLSRSAASDRPNEAESRYELVALVVPEPTEERGRKSLVLDRRHEAGTGDLPERRRDECIPPPSSPTRDRTRRHLDDRSKTLDA